MARTKGSKNKKSVFDGIKRNTGSRVWEGNKNISNLKDNDVYQFLKGFQKDTMLNKAKRKDWPKGKKRGPRKLKDTYEGIPRGNYKPWESIDANHQAHLKLHADMLKNMPKQYSDPKMDFKVLLVTLAKTILTFFKK